MGRCGPDGRLARDSDCAGRGASLLPDSLPDRQEGPCKALLGGRLEHGGALWRLDDVLPRMVDRLAELGDGQCVVPLGLPRRKYPLIRYIRYSDRSFPPHTVYERNVRIHRRVFHYFSVLTYLLAGSSFLSG